MRMMLPSYFEQQWHLSNEVCVVHDQFAVISVKQTHSVGGREIMSRLEMQSCLEWYPYACYMRGCWRRWLFMRVWKLVFLWSTIGVWIVVFPVPFFHYRYAIFLTMYRWNLEQFWSVRTQIRIFKVWHHQTKRICVSRQTTIFRSDLEKLVCEILLRTF